MRRTIAGLTALLVTYAVLSSGDAEGGRRRRCCNPCYSSNNCCAPQTTCCAPQMTCCAPAPAPASTPVCLTAQMFNFGDGDLMGNIPNTCSYCANCFVNGCMMAPQFCMWDGPCGQSTNQMCPCNSPTPYFTWSGSRHPGSGGKGKKRGRPGLYKKVNTAGMTTAQLEAWENRQKGSGVTITGSGWYFFRTDTDQSMSGHPSHHDIRTRYLQLNVDIDGTTVPATIAYEVTDWTTDSGLNPNNSDAPHATPDPSADPQDGLRNISPGDTYTANAATNLDVRLCFSGRCP